MPQLPISKPATLFYSYAHEDEALREQIENHLSMLKREGLLSSWHDRAIFPGDNWAEEIDEYLKSADLILLLVSPDFLASSYCYEIEMQHAMERHQHGEVIVIPVILRPCDWSNAPFGKLQALPRNGQPITTWSNQDEAFTEIAQQLRRLLEKQTLKKRPTGLMTAQARQNRERMRQLLQKWYQDFLTNSLENAARLDLNFVDKPDALSNPVSLLLRDVRLPDQILPSGTSIAQVYQEANQELLILGEPGSGKSTQLYILAQHLLSLTDADPGAPLPFIFALSSWTGRRGSLERWMVEQLILIYQVPKVLAQQWVTNRQIIPLLDGLDEMEETARPQCISTINYYHQEHLHPLVVCSRSAEYTAASHMERLALQRAVVVQPLTATQITTTLIGGGKQLAGLRAAYKTNPALQELATVPLLLNLLILTYQGTAVRNLPTREAALEQLVIKQYVERMIARKGDSTRYPLAYIFTKLTFLAYQMRNHNQTSFAVEHLQKDWLPPGQRIAHEWCIGLSTGSAFGLVFWLSFGVIGRLSLGVYPGTPAGLVGAISFGLVAGMVAASSQTIILAERRRWSLEEFKDGLFAGLVIFLLPLLPTILIVAAKGDIDIGTRIGGLVTWLIIGLSCGLIAGLSAEQNIERTALLPGTGLHRSFKNGLLAALLVGPIFGLMGGLIGGLAGGLFTAIKGGLVGGLFAALFAVLIGGWFACIQHLFLRFWLWQAGLFPFRATAFLEDACARHLIKRVGGTYQFMHRLLLDYFADLEQRNTHTTATGDSSTVGLPSGAAEHEKTNDTL